MKIEVFGALMDPGLVFSVPFVLKETLSKSESIVSRPLGDRFPEQ